MALLFGCESSLPNGGSPSATDNATTWARQVGLKADAIVCDRFDSDGDGYVSCAFRTGTDVTVYECAGLFSWNHGCRTPKASVAR